MACHEMVGHWAQDQLDLDASGRTFVTHNIESRWNFPLNASESSFGGNP